MMFEIEKKKLEEEFKSVAKHMGFSVRGRSAWSSKDGVQRSMSLTRSRFGPDYQVELAVRIERPADVGNEILKSGDAGTSIVAKLSGDEKAQWLASTRLDSSCPLDQRAEMFGSILRTYATRWFDRLVSRDSVLRLAHDDEYRSDVGAIVHLQLYQDFGIPLPRRSGNETSTRVLGMESFTRLRNFGRDD